MACNNGKKGLHSPYGMITDLNITYTGCSTTCNGEEIKPGMRLREILDILIGDCAEGVSVTWGDIIGNIEDQTDLVQFIQDNTPSVMWGNIDGNIEDQVDLVQFIKDNGLDEDRVGDSLFLSDDGKLNAGAPYPTLSSISPDYKVVAITLKDELVIEDFMTPNTFKSGVALIDVGASSLLAIGGGDILVNSDANINCHIGGDFEVTRLDESGRIFMNDNGSGISSPGNISLYSIGDILLSTAGGEVRVGRSVLYFNGMPASPTDNTLPTIGYVRDTIVADAISTLQNTIDALEARIEALENA